MRPSSASAGVSNGFFAAGAADRGRSTPAGTSCAKAAAVKARARPRVALSSRRILEDQLERELILARVQSQIRLGNLAETAGAENRSRSRRARADAGKRGTPLGDVDVGLAEVFRVRDVVNFGAKLQLNRLANGEILEQGEVGAPLVRAIELRAHFAADGADRLRSKGVDIDPVGVTLVGRSIGLSRHDIGTIDGDEVAYVRRDGSRGIEHRERHARLIEGEQVGLPPAQGELRQLASALSERQLIVQAEGDAVLDTDVGVAPVVGPIIRKNRPHGSRTRGPSIGNVGEISREGVVGVRSEAPGVTPLERHLHGVVFGCAGCRVVIDGSKIRHYTGKNSRVVYSQAGLAWWRDVDIRSVLQMPGDLANIAGAENIRAHLLLERQIPLHDIGLRVIDGVRSHGAGKLVIDGGNRNGRSSLGKSSGTSRTGRRARARLREAIKVERNERRIIEVHGAGSVVLGIAAHTETAPDHETRTRRRGETKARLEIGVIRLHPRGRANPKRIATGGRACSGQDRIEVGTFALSRGDGAEM